MVTWYYRAANIFCTFEEARNRTADAWVKVQMEAAIILPVFARVAYVCLYVGAVAVAFDLFSNWCVIVPLKIHQTYIFHRSAEYILQRTFCTFTKKCYKNCTFQDSKTFQCHGAMLWKYECSPIKRGYDLLNQYYYDTQFQLWIDKLHQPTCQWCTQFSEGSFKGFYPNCCVHNWISWYCVFFPNQNNIYCR